MRVRAQPSRMSGKAFKNALATLGLTIVGAAELLGVNQTTSQRWASDDQDVPRAVEIALKLMVKYKVKPEDVQ